MHPIDGSHETLPRPFHNLFARLGKERRPVIEIPGARDPSNPSKLALSPWRVRGCGTGGPRRRVINFWTVGRTRTRIHMRGGRRENGRGGAFYTAFTDARDAARFTRQGTACVRACVRAAVVWVSRGGHLSSEVCADSITREKERQTERTPSAKQRQGR